MFFPIDSLKRGGRFYLCWVADSWPLRFATITHRQLWSQDVRKTCDDLMHFITNESGRPDHRFSLRLSSKLMRGLVRIYQRKVTVFFSELCMINANVTKHVNRRFIIPEVNEVQRISRPRPQITEQDPQFVLPEEEENEQRIEFNIQNSGNVVTNIHEITLKEVTIPEIQLPPNDGFGEENPDQALQTLADRTLEMMMVPTEPSAHQSGLDLPGLDLTDKSHDRSRLVVDRQMERISEHDVTLFRKSKGEELSGPEFEKEIPEIPEIPIPEPPILSQEQAPLEQEPVEKQAEPVVAPVAERPAVTQPEEIELEELEELEPQAKRRRVRKLVIDKKTKIDAKTLRARIENPNVELRCEDSSDDIIEIRVPVEIYMRRPCHAGSSIDSNLSLEITRLFMRNLGVVYRSPRAERDFQEEIMHPLKPDTRATLNRIDEVEDSPLPERVQIQPEHMEANITYPDIDLAEQVHLSKDKFPEMDVQEKGADITEMLTQKIDTLSQQRKRSALTEDVSSPKRKRSIGCVTFRKSQNDRQMPVETLVIMESGKLAIQMEQECDKENAPENMQQIVQSKEDERSVTAMLQEAGVADIIQTFRAPEVRELDPVVTSQRKSSRGRGSEGSETPLGSLDRTKVSLGDSDHTTDSKRFIRYKWGTEGTMIKILRFIRQKSKPITVRKLISKGPVIPGHTRIIAARCFASILKLKQHAFITINKCPDTLEIEDINLGPKFD